MTLASLVGTQSQSCLDCRRWLEPSTALFNKNYIKKAASSELVLLGAIVWGCFLVVRSRRSKGNYGLDPLRYAFVIAGLSIFALAGCIANK